MLSAPPKTLADWYLHEQPGTANGGLAAWQRNALGMIFDGIPLGAHVLPPDDDDAANEKLWEKDACARALVSAKLDGAIIDLRSVPVARAQTPDFAARLVDGRGVAVEHSRICAENDKLLAKGLSLTQQQATELVGTSALPRGRVVFAFQGAPLKRYVPEAVDEMVRAMRATITFRGTERVPVDGQYPLLAQLGVHWTVTDAMVPAQAVVEPWLIETDPQVVANEIFGVIKSKAAKHPAYLAHGEAAWLTVWVDTRFCLSTTVLYLLECMDIDRGPFEKLIVGCSTRANVYDANGPMQQVATYAPGGEGAPQGQNEASR